MTEEQIKAAIFEESHDLDFQFIPWSNDKVFRFVIEQVNIALGDLRAERDELAQTCNQLQSENATVREAQETANQLRQTAEAERDEAKQIVNSYVERNAKLAGERDAAYVRGLEKALELMRHATFYGEGITAILAEIDEAKGNP